MISYVIFAWNALVKFYAGAKEAQIEANNRIPCHFE
jgi:hypothetical protein